MREVEKVFVDARVRGTLLVFVDVCVAGGRGTATVAQPLLEQVHEALK